jgi:hypothetical protein
VSALTIGASLRIADLSLPAGVTTELEEDVAIVIGQAPRVVALEGEEGEGEEGEGAEGEAAEGAAAEGGVAEASGGSDGGGEG